MPEVLTKHPEVVIQVLESGGAKCGDGLPQKILKQCPAGSFCALPGGETCVYGVGDVGKMTQIKKSDLASQICSSSARGCSTGALAEPSATLLFTALALGFACGRWSRRRSGILTGRR
jgi:hypothetical protein